MFFKIAYFIPIICDDSFHYAIYAIMRQAVGDAKSLLTRFLIISKICKKKV